ncbi:hypothetical protein B0H13DRAFT_2312698 [Mycena leptocephala]|nr:hypothetical protein B0H13DRAFT_2312698 [Mycena leptocephala]
MRAQQRTFSPKSTTPPARSHLLERLAAARVHATLLGSDSSMREHAGQGCLGRWGAIADTLSENADRDEPPYQFVDVCGDLWVGLVSFRVRAGYPYFYHRAWQIHAHLHSYTLVPSPSTARLLREKGWGNLRVVGKGVYWGVLSMGTGMRFIHSTFFALSALYSFDFGTRLRSSSFIYCVDLEAGASVPALCAPHATLHNVHIDFDEARGAETARVWRTLLLCCLPFILISSSSNINPAPSPLPLICHPILPRVLPHSPSLFLSSAFSTPRSPALCTSWDASSPADVVIFSVGRLSPEKNLGLVVWARCAVGAVHLFYYSFMISMFG